MTIALNDITDIAGAILNASRTTFGTYDDNLYFLGEVQKAAYAADKEVCNTIIGTMGHRDRRAFAATKTVSSGSQVKDEFLGGVVIDGSPGKPATAYQLQKLMFNPSNNTLNKGYYHWDGTLITFTGTTCTIDYINFTPNASQIQAPDNYLFALIAGCLALVFPKEGTKTAAANHFAGLFQQCIANIKDQKTTFPTPTIFTGGGMG